MKKFHLETQPKVKKFNDYYAEKMDLLFNRLNFLHSLHTSLQSKTLILVDYLNSHLWGSNELITLFHWKIFVKIWEPIRITWPGKSEKQPGEFNWNVLSYNYKETSL